MIVEDAVEHPHLARNLGIIGDHRGGDMLDDDARFHDRHAVIDQQRKLADWPELQKRSLVFWIFVTRDVAKLERRVGVVERDQRLPGVGREGMTVEDEHYQLPAAIFF